MSSLEDAIEETLKVPEAVIRSRGDYRARLYYRFYPDTPVGGKLLCVVVKVQMEDAFVLTAYLTYKLKGGENLWSAES